MESKIVIRLEKGFNLIIKKNKARVRWSRWSRSISNWRVNGLRTRSLMGWGRGVMTLKTNKREKADA